MDVAPKKRTTPRERIAQLVRLLGTTEHGERANTWRRLVCAMDDAKVNFSDLGNWIEHGGERDDGKYNEAEMLEFARAARAEGVDAGIKIGLARAHNGGGNGHLALPKADEMASYCHDRLGQLKNDWQRDFVADIFRLTRRTTNLSLRRLANLAKIYIEMGGRV